MTTAMSSLIWPSLPSPIILPLLFVVALFAIKYPTGVFLSGGAFGIVWMASVGHWQVNWQLSTQEIRQIHKVTGSIESIVQNTERIRFNLRLSRIDGKRVLSAPKIRLSWRNPGHTIKQGHQLQLEVKLKPVHGLANEGGFRYQQWLMANRIVATGYVRDNQTAVIVDDNISTRQTYIDLINKMPLQHRRWIIALSLGERGQFTQPDWQLLQETGTAHLMAISGLHLGIVATLCYSLFALLFHLICRFFAFPQSINYQLIILSLVCFCTLYYAVLAGFALPTFRAWIMLVFWTLLICLNRFVRPYYFLLYCSFIFMLIAPLSILSASFWLSFSAVFAIALISWRWPAKHDETYSLLRKITQIVKQTVVLQIALSILLIPVVAGFFSLFVPSSSLINLIAIPFVTFILVPICLAGVLCLPFSYGLSFLCFSTADKLLEFSVNALLWLVSGLPGAVDLPHVSAIAWLFILLWLLLLALPIGRTSKVTSGLLLLPFLSYVAPNRTQPWFVHSLDVGHGLTIVIERHGRAMVYDVGAAFQSGFNMADSALLPFLKYRGINSIDWLFISHDDNDHGGSLPIVLRNIHVNQVLTNQDSCNASLDSTWQGLEIKGLWPHPLSEAKGNDASCMLRISDGRQSALLPGDVSSRVEKELIENDSLFLESDVLIAGHHGSKTSSSNNFVNAVAPKHVIFSHGQHASWGFPAQIVVNRFFQKGAQMHSTSESGQISVTFNVGDYPSMQVSRYREHLLPVWYNQTYGLNDLQ